MTQISRINRVTDMKQIFRIFTLITVAVLTAGQAWAGSAADRGFINIGTVTDGTLTFYKEATCQNKIAITDGKSRNLSSSDLTDGKIYIKATPEWNYSGVNVAFTAHKTAISSHAEARTFTRGSTPGIGQAITVSAVSDKPGIYCFTMPDDGNNATVSATFPAKTKTNVSYIDIDGKSKQAEAYVLDGTEATLGEPGGSSSSLKETWYVCNTTLSYTTFNYSSNCNVNIILADNVEMSVINSNGNAINNSYGNPSDSQASFGVYGQSKGSGRGALTVKCSSFYAIEIMGGITISHCKLTVEGNNYGIVVKNDDVTISGAEVNATATSGHAILSDGGGVSITGGTITAKGSSYGIRAEGSDKDVTIIDAEVNVTATAGHAIYCDGGGVSITGGTVTAVGDSYGIRAEGSGKDVTISGAEVNATATGTYGHAIHCNGGGVSITGGTVTAEGVSYGIRAQGSGKDVTISGAEVNATATSGHAIYCDGGGVSITGGTVTAVGDSYGIRAYGSGKDVTIIGADVNATGTYGYAINSTHGGVSITGGTVTAKGKEYGIRAEGSDKDVTIIDAEVNVNVSAAGYAIISDNGGVSITGGTVTAEGGYYGIRAKGSGYDLTIIDAEVNATATAGYAINSSKGGVSITGGTITAKGYNYGISAEGSDKDVTISNAKVTANVTGTYGDAISSKGGVSITGGAITAEGVSYGIISEGSDKDVTISNAKVTVNVTGTWGYAIYSREGGVSITGGTVTATGKDYGIRAEGSGKDVVISGAEVNATALSTDGYAIYSSKGGVSITGGAVTVDGTKGISSSGDVILDWTNTNDFIKVSSYSVGFGKAVKTADGKRFVAYAPGATESDPMTATVIISGSIAKENDSYPIDGKTLKPLVGYIVTVADDISLMDGTTAKAPDFTIDTTPYYIYKASTEQNPVTVTASYNGTDFVTLGGLPEGTTFDAVANQPMQRSFAMPAEDVALTTTTVTGLTASGTLSYSGSAQTPAINLDESAFETTNYTVTGITPKEGTNSQLTDGSAVNAGEYSIAITGLGQYIGTTSVDFTIGKADYDGTTTVSTYVRSGQATTGKTLALPALPDGASYATWTVEEETAALIDGAPTVSGTTLTFSTTSQGTSATITIGVTGATNYNDYDVVVTVTAQDKEETVITIRESTPITKTYGDADFTLHPSVPAAAGSGVWTWASAHTDVATISDGTVTIQKAGEATIRLFFESQTHFGEASIKLTVDPKTLGIAWNTDGLVYDGTPKAPTAHLTGVKSGDDCSVEISVEGDHTKAGAGYTATASLRGTKVGNYALPEGNKSKEFSISPKPVTVSSTGVTANKKIYDGTTSATLNGSFAFDDGMIIDGDNVTITGGTGAFADKNVGTGKTVVISGVTLGGTDAGNYTLSAQPTGITGSITKKTVTVTSGITASNKTYDGTTSATLSGSSAVISGKVTGDVLGVSASGSFSNKNVGTGKTVNISSISLTGSDRGNYVLASSGNQTSATASITKKSLTVTADDKSVEYGDAAPTYTASYSGFVSGESKSNLSGSLSFSCSYTSSSNTGTYTITPSGHTSSNYNINYAAGTLTVGAKDVAYSGGTITKDENGYTVTLDEGTGSANTLPDDADLYSLTYSRTLTPPGSGEGEVTIGGQAANLYTVCLPFSPETGTDVKYYTLSGVSGETVSFEEVTTPAANTPYLIAVTGSTNIAESCTGMVVTSMEINSTTKDGYTFTGTFTGLTHAQAVGKHILQSHNMWRVVEASGSVFIPPFRAYIESTSGARMLTGSLDDEATGIDSLRLLDADGSEQWYDLNGRRISKPTRKGLYIHNGKVTTTK